MWSWKWIYNFLWRIDSCVVLSKHLWGHVMLNQKWSGSAHVHPDSYMKKSNNAKTWANKYSIRLLIYYIFRSFFECSFQCWVLIFICFSRGKSVSPTLSGILSLIHTMACGVLKSTPFSLKRALSSSSYFYLYDYLLPLLPLL